MNMCVKFLLDLTLANKWAGEYNTNESTFI